MTNYNDFLNEQLKDKELKKEYDALEAEFSIIQAILDARKASGLTQKDLAERSGIAQADISKIETGNANPSLKTLQRLADGMGMRLKLEFVPANRWNIYITTRWKNYAGENLLRYFIDFLMNFIYTIE